MPISVSDHLDFLEFGPTLPRTGTPLKHKPEVTAVAVAAAAAAAVPFKLRTASNVEPTATPTNAAEPGHDRNRIISTTIVYHHPPIGPYVYAHRHRSPT